MSREQFEDLLRTFVRQKPFKPFVVRKVNGESIYVDEPAVAFDGGAAGFIGPDNLVHFFDCEQVATMTAVPSDGYGI